jgi:drug/metabolite transporter (DMT)-like permease
MTLRAQSYLNLGLCILLWAPIPVASKKILAELTNLQMLFWSTIFSVIALGALVISQRKVATLSSYLLRDFMRLSWLGFLGGFLYYILLYGAFARTSAAEGFILAYTWPILISLLAVPFLGERLTSGRFLAVATSFGGGVVIVTRGRLLELSVTSLPGNLLALCGALVFAFFSVQGKRVTHDLTIAAFIYFLTALICTAAAIGFVGVSPLPSAPVWGWLLYNGLLVNGISYLFWFKALEHGDTFIVSNLLYLTPALSLLFVRLLLDEPIHASVVLGLLLIVGGILLQSWPNLLALVCIKGSMT